MTLPTYKHNSLPSENWKTKFMPWAMNTLQAIQVNNQVEKLGSVHLPLGISVVGQYWFAKDEL